MKRTSIVILFLVIALMIFAFTACGDGKKQETETATETTTELTTIATTAEATSATDEETAEIITDTPETTKKQVYEPVENTKKPTEAPVNTPPGGGLFTFNDEPLDPGAYVQDPNVNVDHWVQKEAEELGENLDWELY